MICNALVCTFIEAVERQLLNERDFVRQYVVVLRPKLYDKAISRRGRSDLIRPSSDVLKLSSYR